MDSTIFTVMFLASAPIALMPSAIALFLRRKRAPVILGFNLLAWGGLYCTMRAVMGAPAQPPFEVPIPIVMVVWLVLLRSAIVTPAE
jgi:hypothetical protein